MARAADANRSPAALPIVLKWRRSILQSGLPPTTRHVLLTLSCFMNNTGGECYPTTIQIAEATGLSERAVCTHIAAAKEKGWLRVSTRNGGAWKRHEYNVNWPGMVTERGSVKIEGDGTGPTEPRSVSGASQSGEHTEPRSVESEASVQPELQTVGCASLNDVQYDERKITPCAPHVTGGVISTSQGSSLNDVQCLTEPDDKNPLNDVQSNSPYTSPIPLQREGARERERLSQAEKPKNGLGKKKDRSVAKMRPQVAGGDTAQKAADAEAAKLQRLADRIAKLPKHEREAAWLAAMEGKL